MNQKLQYFQQIDTLRLLAATLVCISHWLPNHWIEHLQLGRFAVDLFFVISGFLISRILLQLNDHFGFDLNILKTFFIRRVLRIFPIYYFVVFITIIFRDDYFDAAIFWNLSYASNLYILKIGYFPGIMSHFWTLSVEEHFYLIWPILILAFPRSKALLTITIVGMVSILSRLFFLAYGYSTLFPRIFTISCFDAFAIGGLLAYIFTYYPSKFRKIKESKILFLTIILGLLSTIFLDFNEENGIFWDFVAFRLFASLTSFFFIALAIDSNSKILSNNKLVFFGKLSYSMYLLHNFVPGFLMGLQYPSNIYLRVVLYYIFLLIISFIAWKLIERPFNKIKNKFPYPIQT